MSVIKKSTLLRSEVTLEEDRPPPVRGKQRTTSNPIVSQKAEYHLTRTFDSDRKLFTLETVYSAKRSRIYLGECDVDSFGDASVSTKVIIKIVDSPDMFVDERHALETLRENATVVKLLATRPDWPTTVLCQTCGHVHYITSCHCPGHLQLRQIRGNVVLICSEKQDHLFDENSCHSLASKCCDNPNLTTAIFGSNNALILERCDDTIQEYMETVLAIAGSYIKNQESSPNRVETANKAVLYLALSAVHSVAVGLADSHRAGILHLDVSPNNAMYKSVDWQWLRSESGSLRDPVHWPRVSRGATFCLTDYGVSRAKVDPGYTTVMGQKYFCAPETGEALEIRPTLWTRTSEDTCTVRFQSAIPIEEGDRLENGTTAAGEVTDISFSSGYMHFFLRDVVRVDDLRHVEHGFSSYRAPIARTCARGC